MSSVLFVVLSLFGQVTGDCGCGQGDLCPCGPGCQCGQFVQLNEVARARKEAIRKADGKTDEWKGWTKGADGWWYPPVQIRTPVFQELESRGRPIFRGGRRGGC